MNNPHLVTVMEKAVAPHSSTLAWKIPWTEDPVRLQSMGSLRVRHATDCSPPGTFVLGIFQAGIPLSNRRYYKGFTGLGPIKEKI